MQDAPTSTASSSPPPGFSGTRRSPRSLDLALFLAAILWYKCAEDFAVIVTNGLSLSFDFGAAQALVQAVLLLVLLVCGLAVLRVIEHRRAPLALSLGLPRRSTSGTEWLHGAAFGWALAVATVVPMLLGGALSVHLWTAPRAFLLLGLGLLTMAVVTLAQALGIYGYAFHRLIDATGPVRATLILVALAAIHAALTPTAFGTPDGTRILVAMLTVLLFSLCWLRTHGLWLLWGLIFAWGAATAILFGLPLGGDNSFGSVIDTRASGANWLTGGQFGPAAAAFTIVVLLVAIPILFRVTSDYAWNYTHPPLIPGGYDVNLVPQFLKEHAANGAQAAKPAKPSPPPNPTTPVQPPPATPQDPE